jgi:hypothetical protein
MPPTTGIRIALNRVGTEGINDNHGLAAALERLLE